MSRVHVVDGRGLDAAVRAIQAQTVLYYPDAGSRNADLREPWPGATTLYPDGAGGWILEAWTGTTWRPLGGSGGGSGVSDHGALTGLLDDDHPQYLTDARADALFLTPAEGDARYLIEEVAVGPNPPTAGTEELWYDTDPSIGGPFSFKASLGTGVSTTSGTTVAIVLTGAIAVGDVVVVRVAADNLSGTAPTFTATDTGGNTYVTHHQVVAPTATPAGGVAGAIIVTKATVAVSAGGTITVTLSGAVDAKAAYAESFTGGTNTLRAAPTGGGTTTGAVGPHDQTPTVGDLVLGWAAWETNAVAATGDSDTTNGAWSTMATLFNAAGGTAATRVQVAGQWKIPTASGLQRWGTSASTSDCVGGLIALASTSGAAPVLGTGALRARVAGAWVDVAVTDHGALAGLADDDHPQYLTSARGDALFLTPAEVVAGTNITVTRPGDGTVTISAAGAPVSRVQQSGYLLTSIQHSPTSPNAQAVSVGGALARDGIVVVVVSFEFGYASATMSGVTCDLYTNQKVATNSGGALTAYGYLPASAATVAPSTWAQGGTATLSWRLAQGTVPTFYARVWWAGGGAGAYVQHQVHWWVLDV